MSTSTQCALLAPRVPYGSAVLIRSDNTTSVSYVVRFGGRVTSLHDAILPLLVHAIRHDLTFLGEHLPGMVNERADAAHNRYRVSGLTVARRPPPWE